MALFFTMIACMLFCVVLAFFDPIIAVIVFGGTILGCLLRGLYLLKQIHQHLMPEIKEAKVEAALKRYREERELKGIE